MADTEVMGDTSEKMSTEDISSPQEDINEDEKMVKEELVKEETEELKPDSIVQETVDENGDVFEETTQVTRKVVKRTMKITETSSTTKTTTMTTPAKLYGKDLSEYDEVDVDALLAQLSPEEINILAKEVDPDDNFLPPNQRCSYECTKDPTGPLDRKKLIEHINKEALETPDLPEIEPFVKGTVRGKKWVPPARDEREIAADEQIAIDMGEEYEHALSDATQEEIIDLAAILGFHSMMNQDQYHASLLNKGQPIGMGWDGITKSTAQKLYPMDPPNNTDVDESVKRVKEDDPKLIELNLNNIKNISDEKFEQLFKALPQNEHLEVLSLTNVGLTDKTALLLAEAIEKSKTLRVLNVETNFISPPVVVTLVKSLLKARTIEEFRASNQRSTVLGNKIEMEITDLVEKNTSLLRLGLHLEFNDARHRVAAHLQRNIDRNEHELRKASSLSPIPKAASPHGKADHISPVQRATKVESPKPIHLILSPQERIESKSELIASLVSQKQSAREKEEISLAVPQLSRDLKTESKETKSLVQTEKLSPTTDIKIATKPVSEKLLKIDKVNIPLATPQPNNDLKASSVETLVKTEKHPLTNDIKIEKNIVSDTETKQPLNVKVDKQSSPTRYPKIGDLRSSNLSKAVDYEHITAQQNEPVTDNLQNSNEITKHTENSKKRLEEVGKIAKDSPIPIDLNGKVDERSISLSKPLIPEYTSKPLKDTTQLLPDSQLLSETKPPVSSLVNEEAISKSIPLSIDAKTRSVDDYDSLEGTSRNRDRLSESVSPSRSLDEKLSLLRARIDNFAEVVDEKLSSLKSKFDYLDREDQTVDNSVEFSKISETNSVAQNIVGVVQEKVVESVSQEKEPVQLSPKVIPVIQNLAPNPLVKTPNSVGISFVFQSKVFASLPSITSRVEELYESKEEPVTETKTFDVKSIEKLSETNLEISETKVGKVAEKTTNPILRSDLKTDEQRVSIGTVEQDVAPELKVKALNQEAVQVINKPLEIVFQNNEDNPINLKPYNFHKISNDPLNPGIQKTMDGMAALSFLSVKKGDILQIDPVIKVEVATHTVSTPSPITKLSLKKCESQKIDPVKTKNSATQSLPRLKPMSFLSVKKRDCIAIAAANKSEVSTQFDLEKPKAEASSQTIEEEPIKTLEDTTQTPLVFSSLDHDFVFPGLRRVPYLPRSKTINIGGGDRVIVKPSSKPINEVLMLLYPILQNYSKPAETKSFGLEEDIVKVNEPDSTIKDLEVILQQATEESDKILQTPLKKLGEEETEKVVMKTEIEIPLSDEHQCNEEPKDSNDGLSSVATEARYETKFTAVEKLSAMSHTKIESEEHVEFTDEAFKSVASVTSSDGERITKTSIRSANMWEALSSNLIKASEKTLMDLSKAEFVENSSSTRTKIGQVSVYSSIEDLSHSSRSKFSDRQIGGLIKTVETTSVYSSLEDIPYTKYSDRYRNDKVVSTTSVYSSTEDLPQYSSIKISDRYAIDQLKSVGKSSVYSSTEDISDIPYSKYSDRYSEVKANYMNAKPVENPEHLSLLPRSKFSDRYKSDYAESHRKQPKFPVSQDLSYSSAKYDKFSYNPLVFGDHSRSHYKSAEELLHRSNITDRDVFKTHDNALQTSILSAISRNKSALRPYTYVPASTYADLTIDHIGSRPASPSTMHTSTLHLKISPSGISELPQSRAPRYTKKKFDKPIITVSRPKEDIKTFRAISPIPKALPSSKFLSPRPLVSDPTNDESIDESFQPSLDISSAYIAENNTTTTTSKKRANIMDTIKTLKNRVRDVITTEDRSTETHRLPSNPSVTAALRRAARANARNKSLQLFTDFDEKEI